MKKLFDLLRKHSWILLILFLAIPIIVCVIVSIKTPFVISIAGDANSWIGFYGNYFGAVFGSIFAAIIGASIALYVVDIEKNNRTKEQVQELQITNICEYVDIYYSFYGTISLLKDLALHFCNLANGNNSEASILFDKKAIDDEIKNYRMYALKLTAFMKIKGKLITDTNTYTKMREKIQRIKEKTETFMIGYYESYKLILGTNAQKKQGCIAVKKYIDNFTKEVDDFQQSMDLYYNEIIQVTDLPL